MEKLSSTTVICKYFKLYELKVATSFSCINRVSEGQNTNFPHLLILERNVKPIYGKYMTTQGKSMIFFYWLCSPLGLWPLNFSAS
jgi:hypothetical protein